MRLNCLDKVLFLELELGVRMRRDIVDRINKLSIETPDWDIDVMKTYNDIFDYVEQEKIPVVNLNLELINGMLFIDGIPKDKVGMEFSLGA